ncbi:MAG: hypothetical protein ACI9MC_001485 [Kiritimatiellia bacterium]|jgi:hypothetical protein
MRWWSLVCLVYGACNGAAPDPDLVRRRAALDAYERGVDAMRASKPALARAAFERSLEVREGDPLLLAYFAQAEAADGDLAGAIATLRAVLQQRPLFSEARYNLACYLARSGDVESAAVELRRALLDGARDPREVLDDPDLAPHLSHPALAFLPKSLVDVTLSGPDGSVFLGSEVRLTVQVAGRSLDVLTVDGPQIGGPLQLVRVDEVRSKDSNAARVTWIFRVDGPGQVTVGPLVVHAGERSATTQSLTVLALAPPDRPVVDHAAIGWRLPSNVAGGEVEADAWIAGSQVIVRSLPGDRVQVDGTVGRGVPWTYSVSETQQWIAQTWTDPGAGVQVKIGRRGNVILERAPRR